MGLYKLELSIDGDFGIDIHAIAELARAQRIDAHHAWNLLDATPDFAFEFVIARRVSHIVQGIFHHVVGDLQNDDANREAGNGIARGKAQHARANAQKRAD